jgi:hypothetical protein
MTPDLGPLAREARILLARHGDLLLASPECPPPTPEQMERLRAVDAAHERLCGPSPSADQLSLQVDARR